MQVEHSLKAHGRCPVDGAIDVYDVLVRARRVVKVEDIIAAVDRLTSEAILQENFTLQLASVLRANVVTVCTHSGVTTTCEV